MIYFQEESKASNWRPKIEELPPRSIESVPSSVQPPKPDLKALPFNLKYLFLGENETFLVIISSKHNARQEGKLLQTLNVRSHIGSERPEPGPYKCILTLTSKTCFGVMLGYQEQNREGDLGGSPGFGWTRRPKADNILLVRWGVTPCLAPGLINFKFNGVDDASSTLCIKKKIDALSASTNDVLSVHPQNPATVVARKIRSFVFLPKKLISNQFLPPNTIETLLKPIYDHNVSR